MYVKELIEILKKYPQDYNVCITDRGSGASPFHDLDASEIEEGEDSEVGDVQCPCIVYKSHEVTETELRIGEIKPDVHVEYEDDWLYHRKVVILFSAINNIHRDTVR